MVEDGHPVAATEQPKGGAWTVIAAPFTHPERLRRFIDAVAGIPGVTELTARRFRLGELSLSLCYRGAEPLEERLAALTEFRPRVTTTSSVAIWLELDEEQPSD